MYYLSSAIIVFSAFTAGISAATVSRNETKTNARLWELMGMTNSLNQRKHEAAQDALQSFATYCCRDVWGYSNCGPEVTNPKQINYFAYIDETNWNTLTSATMVTFYLKDRFDPRKPPKGTDKYQMCNCKRVNGKCQEYNLNDLNVERYFAEPTVETKTHGEEKLLLQIDNLASQDNREKTFFFLYSFNSPCSTDNGCIKKIFESTATKLYRNKQLYHKMRVGFVRWYPCKQTDGTYMLQEVARDKFCEKVNENKDTKYGTYNFAQGLRFTKTTSWNGKEEDERWQNKMMWNITIPNQQRTVN